LKQLCFCSKTTASSDFDTSLTGSATTTVSELTLYFLEKQQFSPDRFPGIVIFDQLEVL
jgi:hypothetical protein